MFRGKLQIDIFRKMFHILKQDGKYVDFSRVLDKNIHIAELDTYRNMCLSEYFRVLFDILQNTAGLFLGKIRNLFRNRIVHEF